MSASLPPGARPPERAVWLDGRIVRGAEATLSLFDRGARDGGGIFETVRVESGRPLAWQRHMERLVLAAAELGFPVPPGPRMLREALEQVLEAQGIADAVARITVTRGIAGGRPTRTGAWIDAEPLAGRLWRGTRTGKARAIVSHLVFEPGWIGRYKTTSRIAWDLAREQAIARGVDEALLTTGAGVLLEGAASNVFVVRDGAVRTPPLSANVLPGITRALVLELCAALGLDAAEAPLARADLERADEVFLTNSVQEVLPLETLDGRALGARTVGDRLRVAYRERITTLA